MFYDYQGRPSEMTDDELVYWLSLSDDERHVAAERLRNEAWERGRQQRWEKYLKLWYPDRFDRERDARAERRRQLEQDWLDGLRSKPRHLRKRWRSRKRIGSDTRRRRADGKLLGNHHYPAWWKERSPEDLTRVERRAGEYVRRCHERELDDNYIARHLHPPSVEWGNRRPCTPF